MSGLTNFLTPYSHLIFANRDKVIVLLALVLGWTVIQLLVARWRTERLERDLVTARASMSTSPARSRQVSAAMADEAPAESGGLPPVKGGRSYARNLGSALQKAGIPPAGPQLYSPPVPTGWNPNTGNGQPSQMQPPMQPPTYAPQPGPWGAPQPPAPQTAPWAYPAGATRSPFAPQPMNPAAGPYAPPPSPAQYPANQGQQMPAGYPPAAPASFPQPFPTLSNAPEAVRPTMDAPPQPASAPPFDATPPAFPADDSGAKENARRGKPKRRRFSLSVLDNLEKIVQPRAAEPAPSNVAAPPPVSTRPVSAASAPAAPVAEPLPAPTPEPAVETPSLFDYRAPETQPEPVAEEPESAEEPVEPVAPVVDQSQAEPGSDQEPESEPAVAAEAPASTRPNMRSMLFGEEPTPAEPVASAEVSEPPATSRWTQSEPVVEEAPTESEAFSTETETEHREPEPEPEAPVEAAAEPQPAYAPFDVSVAEPEQAAPAEVLDTVSIAPPVEPDRQEGKAGVLVIIEDDQAAADYYATLFRGNGYEVNVANDGVSGVDLCLRVQPQVIMLDVMMPRQNGILVLQTLRASDETRNTPVVVMSNFSEPTLIKRALQLGALEYVIKTQVEGPALLSAMPHWMNREKAFAA